MILRTNLSPPAFLEDWDMHSSVYLQEAHGEVIESVFKDKEAIRSGRYFSLNCFFPSDKIRRDFKRVLVDDVDA